LAGGLNLYGYADGDPINYSDPFGLCTPWPDCMFQAAANWGASRGGAVGGAVLNIAAAANAASEAFGTNDVGRAAADGDVGGVAIAAASMLPVGKLARGSSLVREAADQVATRIGRNSVSIRTQSGVTRVDLRGRAHGGVETPHVHNYTRHTNPATGATSLSSDGLPTPATLQDVRTARRAAERQP